MKRFIARLSIEFIVIATTTIVATQLVKSGYLALGVSILSVYAMFSLYRIGVEKINAQRDRNIKEAQINRLEAELSVKEAQMRRLEAALVDASIESLWVSDVETRDDKVVYKIDAPGHGRIVIYLPNSTKTEDVPETSKEG